MKKVRLEFEEKLTYRREVDLFVPDDMDEDELEDVLSIAESGADDLGDFIWKLQGYGITCDEYDESLDSPYSVEIECDQYDFIDDGEED